MNFIRLVIESLFSGGVLINALLFLLQAVKIYTAKTSQGVSLITFLGFLLIQFTIVLHGVIQHDVLLVCGYIVSMLACSAVMVMILVYKSRV